MTETVNTRHVHYTHGTRNRPEWYIIRLVKCDNRNHNIPSSDIYTGTVHHSHSVANDI